MRILLTAGATREPVDAVRFISNVSTGRTGAALANELRARGHDVRLLHGTGAAQPRDVRESEEFSSAADLAARLRHHLATGAFDALIMAAAVADYRPESADAGKLPSSLPSLSLPLVRNEKILPQLKSFSPRPLVVIGFKLTSGAGEDARKLAVSSLFNAGGLDAVIHNDLVETRSAPKHPFRMYIGTATGTPEETKGADALAASIDTFLKEAGGRGR